jgi:hypothetical protein
MSRFEREARQREARQRQRALDSRRVCARRALRKGSAQREIKRKRTQSIRGIKGKTAHAKSGNFFGGARFAWRARRQCFVLGTAARSHHFYTLYTSI